MSENVVEIISRIISALNIKSQRQLAEVLDINPARITDAKKRGHIPADWIVKLALDHNLNPFWILTGEGSKNISSDQTEGGKRSTVRNVHLRWIVEWQESEFGGNDELALFFYEDLKDKYPSFAKFMEKKRPSQRY